MSAVAIQTLCGIRLSGGPCSGYFSWLAASAVTSIGTSNENSQEHDRDDHAAIDIGVRRFHIDEANGVIKPGLRHLILGQLSNQTQAGLGQRASAEAAEYSRYSSNGFPA